jgi:hypothetical protein
MQAMPDRISPPSLGRLQLRMRAVLRATGDEQAPEQAAGRRDVGGHRTFRWSTQPQECAALRRAAEGETPLSPAEVEHGKRIGVIA